VVITKRKESEATSSTIYNAMDHRDPVLDFENYINDNEDIVDEVHAMYSSGRPLLNAYVSCNSIEMPFENFNNIRTGIILLSESSY